MTTTTQPTPPSHERVALVTGASEGLGRALALGLARAGWRLVVDARRAPLLEQVHAELLAVGAPDVVAVPGDVADAGHRDALRAAVERLGRLDLLVHNASTLGASPQPHLEALDADVLRRVLETNLVAPQDLTRLLLPHLAASRGIVLAVSSDAAVAHYEGWGAYGASKAALDHLVLTWAAEHAEIAWYAVDPGDMRTQMHQDAFPGEDIGDRPPPESVVPALLALLATRPPSGRLRAADVTAPEAVPA
jgi:NAD(P)-dependent dehydrogenase (short-subunit alcohol dehydrogenase family)